MDYGTLQLGFEHSNIAAKVSPEDYERLLEARRVGEGLHDITTEHGALQVALEEIVFVKWDFKPSSSRLGFGGGE